MFSHLIGPCLFNLFNKEKNYLLFCNNISEPPVPLIHNHYVLLTIYSEKKLKKANRKHKL